MKYRKFGRTGLMVSPIVLGSANFSWLTDEADSFEILDHAFELGVNFIDTPTTTTRGRPRRCWGAGSHKAAAGAKRPCYASKCYSPPMEWGAEGSGESARAPGWGRISAVCPPRHIREACDASLKRLQTDYLDLYQMHHIDRNTPWEEVWQAMELLVQQGKVLYVGSSNFAGWHIAQAQEIARSRALHGTRFGAERLQPVGRTVELEVIPACGAYGMAFIPYSPLGGGLLGGKPGDNERGRRAFLPQTAAIEAFAGILPIDRPQPGRRCAGVGCTTTRRHRADRRPAHARAIRSQRARRGSQLDEASLAKLNELFPGPGGAAPEAYAW